METLFGGRVQVRVDNFIGSKRTIVANLPQYLIPSNMDSLGMNEEDIKKYVDAMPYSFIYLLSLLMGSEVSAGSIHATPMSPGDTTIHRSMTNRIMKELMRRRHHVPHGRITSDETEHSPPPVTLNILAEQFHLLTSSTPAEVTYGAPIKIDHAIMIDDSTYVPLMRADRGIVVYRIVTDEEIDRIYIIRPKVVYDLSVEYRGRVYKVDNTDVRLVQCVS